jgi:hypothetical protein
VPEPRPPVPRWLALVALCTLCASGVLTAWLLLSGRADFERPAGGAPAVQAPGEVAPR